MVHEQTMSMYGLLFCGLGCLILWVSLALWVKAAQDWTDAMVPLCLLSLFATVATWVAIAGKL